MEIEMKILVVLVVFLAGASLTIGTDAARAGSPCNPDVQSCP
jgi:hypothetical protein